MSLKATPEAQAQLLDLQALDTRLAQLDHRAAHLPELAVIDGLIGRDDLLRATLLDQQGAVEDLELELSRVESDVAVVEARIARDSERLAGSSSVKDVAALEQELAALRSRRSDLEDIELAVMERLEAAQAELATTTAARDQLAGQLATASSARDVALAELDAERGSARAARQALAESLPADLLALYERQRSRYGTGASLLQHGVSKASGVALLEDELATVRAAAPDDVLICPSSDAILVRTAESGL